jgi:Family of unknown function (DUF5678)
MKNQFTKEQLEKAEELRPDENKWVALVDDKVIASGDSPQVVKKEATRKGYKDFAYHLVPSFSKHYIFLQ